MPPYEWPTSTAQVLPFDQIRDVLDVGREIDRGRSEVAALAEAGQRRREHLMAGSAQRRDDVAPAPAAWNAPCTRTKVVMPNLDQLDWRR
jgi:hypothetical protein